MIIEPLTHSDLDSLKELQPDGWQDITIPFKSFLESDRCNPVKLLLNEKMLGVGTTISHSDTVWLATIVVHNQYRGKGLGTKITEHLINIAKSSGTETIYLDATDLGFPIYKKLGFEAETYYSHYKGHILGNEKAENIISYTSNYCDQVLELDHLISGENRSTLLSENMADCKLYVENGILYGAYFPSLRDGLIIANSERAGVELMKYRLQEKDFAIFPVENRVAVNICSLNGFQQYRKSTRMRLGKRRDWFPDKIFNRISGQLG